LGKSPATTAVTYEFLTARRLWYDRKESAPGTPGLNRKGEQDMAAVKWDEVSGYIEEAIRTKRMVQYNDIIEMAFADGASDDVVDALDAIGSRVFGSASDVREFLVAQGYVLDE